MNAAALARLMLLFISVHNPSPQTLILGKRKPWRYTSAVSVSCDIRKASISVSFHIGGQRQSAMLVVHSEMLLPSHAFRYILRWHGAQHARNAVSLSSTGLTHPSTWLSKGKMYECKIFSLRNSNAGRADSADAWLRRVVH